MDLEFLQKRELVLIEAMNNLDKQYQAIQGHLGECRYLISELQKPKDENSVDCSEQTEVE